MGVLWGNFKILVTKIGLDFGTTLNPPYLCTSIMSELNGDSLNMTKDPELTV